MKLRIPFYVLLAAITAATPACMAQETAAASPATDNDDAEEEKEQSPAQKVQQAIEDGDLGDANTMLDEMDQTNATTEALRRQLSTAYMRKRDYAGVVKQYSAILNTEMERKEPSVAKVASLIGTMRAYGSRTEMADQIPEIIEKGIALAKAKSDPQEPSDNLLGLIQLNQMKSFSLRGKGQTEEAAELLENDYQMAEKLLAANEDSGTAARIFSLAARNVLPALTNRDRAEEIFMKHQTLASTLADAGNVEMATAYASACVSRVASMYRSEPEAAEKLLENVKGFMEKHKDDEKIYARIRNYERSIASYESRIESARKLLELVGKPAPAFDSDVNWVNAASPIDTQGKVVLLDFWALWCGPCIATFPHLKHLTEEYGDKGFQIVGVTRYYNYSWDDEADKAVRGDRSADPNPEVENVALQNFMASHDLVHPTMVVGKESTMHKDYGVSGIPHVALIDQQGNIAMIKVGSGEANAQAIEAKIQELLGLTAAAEAAPAESDK